MRKIHYTSGMMAFRKLATLALKTGRAARLRRTVISENGLRYVVMAGLAAAVTVTGWRLVQTLGFTNSAPLIHATASIPAALSSNATSSNAAAIATAIASQHWFGQARPQAAAPSKAEVKTDGPVKVLGIIFAADDALARAILALNGNERNYRVGDALKNGDKVVAIEPDRVVLAQGVMRYALVLNKPGSAMLAEAPHFNGGGGALHPSVVTANRSPSHAPAAVSAPPVMRGASTLQRLQSLRSRLLSGTQ